MKGHEKNTKITPKIKFEWVGSRPILLYLHNDWKNLQVKSETLVLQGTQKNENYNQECDEPEVADENDNKER